MIYLLILYSALFAPFSHSSQINEYMTKDEIKNYFGTEDVPQHEIISIHHKIDNASLNELLTIKTKIHGIDKEYYLKPVDGFLAGAQTKVWTVKTNGRRLVYTLQTNAMKDALAHFYQDETTMSSISHSKDEDGNSLFTGTIDFDKEVRPIPKHIRYRRDLSKENVLSLENNDESYTKTVDHIILQKMPTQNSSSNDTNSQSRDEHNQKNVLQIKRGLEESTLGAPLIVYPEIMVFLDDEHFFTFNKNVGNAVHYLLNFWYGVDLKYRTLKDPKVFLNIAGIILAENKLPFMKNVDIDDKKVVKTMSLLSFGKHLFREKKIKMGKDYDIAIVLTRRTLVETDNAKELIKGMANMGGACDTKGSERKITSAGIVVDHNNYDGILSATHEIAHILGAPHDGERTTVHIGGPGAENCSKIDGYIMAHSRTFQNHKYFSTCSQKSMSYFLNRKVAECLRNNPADKQLGSIMPRELPGKYISLDEQCRRKGYKNASYVNNTDVCYKLKCANNDYYSAPAAEGSPCGVNKICLGGDCIEDITETYSTLETYTESKSVAEDSIPIEASINQSNQLTIEFQHLFSQLVVLLYLYILI